MTVTLVEKARNGRTEALIGVRARTRNGAVNVTALTERRVERNAATITFASKRATAQEKFIAAA